MTSSTEAENATDLINELKVLSVAQYFLDSFIKQAGVYNYTSLPGAYSRFLSLINKLNRGMTELKFHATNAFVGTVTKEIEQPTDDEADNRSLLYNTFLAAPLLPFGKPGYTESKWSGTNQTGDNETAIGRVLASFAHHCVVDSNKSCLLVDLQGLISPDGSITLIDPQAHT
jgi:hypothetical protein